MKLIVKIMTTNPDALAQLKERLEARPLDTDASGRLHPLTVYITDGDGAVLWGSIWEPDES